MDLSIACVTRAAHYAEPFLDKMIWLADYLDCELVLGADGHAAEAYARREGLRWMPVRGRFLEEMLNPVLEMCTGKYILRLDDDEVVPQAMAMWIENEAHLEHDSWFFPRVHLWPDADHYIANEPFFPDFQGRLTTHDKAQRPPVIHAGQAWPAYRAPVYFEHHVFLAKDKEQRRRTAAVYEGVRLGVDFPPEKVNVVWPEDAPPEKIKIEEIDPIEIMRRADERVWWRQAGIPIPPHLEQQMMDWTKAVKVIRPKF